MLISNLRGALGASSEENRPSVLERGLFGTRHRLGVSLKGIPNGVHCKKQYGGASTVVDSE